MRPPAHCRFVQRMRMWSVWVMWWGNVARFLASMFRSKEDQPWLPVRTRLVGTGAMVQVGASGVGVRSVHKCMGVS